MSAMITKHKKFLKLHKMGSSTHKMVSTPIITTETNLAHLDFSLAFFCLLVFKRLTLR